MMGTETQEMVDALGFESMDALIDATVPTSIRKQVCYNDVFNKAPHAASAE